MPRAKCALPRARARSRPPSHGLTLPTFYSHSIYLQIQLAGVSDEDVTGSDFTHIVQLRLPTGPSGQGQRFNFLGLPGSVNGAAPVAPFNGLLNVSLPCLQVNGTAKSWWSNEVRPPPYPASASVTSLADRKSVV